MRALRLHRTCDLTVESTPLRDEEVDDPVPGPGEVLLDVAACGICHTELDEIEGRTPPSRLPMILGHQVVGRVVDRGPDATRHAVGDRLGVAWIHSACGRCDFCTRGLENLCPDFRGTGRDAPGGYAERMVVHEDFAHTLPESFDDAEIAPLLCAGAIGYRSLRLTGLENGQRLGLTGFGASGQLTLRLVRALHPEAEVYVFARREATHRLARELGAAWAGTSRDVPPAPMDAVIDTTPVWVPILEALRHLRPSGRLVINAIRKETQDADRLVDLDYAEQLWMEKEIKSVANVAREDVRGFLEHAGRYGIRAEFEELGFGDVNDALVALRRGAGRGAKVLRVD